MTSPNHAPPKHAEPDPEGATYVGLEVAARRLAVSTKTIRRLIADGTLPAVRIRKLIRIKSADLVDVGEAVTPSAHASLSGGHRRTTPTRQGDVMRRVGGK